MYKIYKKEPMVQRYEKKILGVLLCATMAAVDKNVCGRGMCRTKSVLWWIVTVTATFFVICLPRESFLYVLHRGSIVCIQIILPLAHIVRLGAADLSGQSTLLKESTNRIHVIMIKRDASITPLSGRAFSVFFAGSRRWERRRAVTTGLYRSIVPPAFSPPLIRLKGRNAVNSKPVISSRG